ncbi:ERMES complex subunit mmm1 [Microsporum canis]|uniref:Maintenance of mitochondrial morphology protein 1 n=1 Tax=Arthroderma otae (strain ATCC MYA-4605 / CBS 113480) TaxID=554155 RepID=MMM1_ARTOC|nr:mitochondrial outer membrane protein MMM1 [Microsporum canis CBS 113480]C5FRT9.1 RecName: Full=Maintenance of mitochondrial morphology protein 1 [Microsporum canis CBS 113480]EEQ32592.1 mitochondrial outer membrane protein MMM1 [Microsporum canis CBS 113480]
MSSPQNTSCPPSQHSLSFTQGLLLGQLSVVLLIGAFIKFFIFGESPSSSSRGISQRTAPRKRSYSVNSTLFRDAASRSLKESASSNVLRPVPSSSTNTKSILRKTYYNAIPTNFQKNSRHRLHHSTHQPESLDWFNVLIAQLIAQYRQTAYILKDSPTSSILDSLTETLNNVDKKPSWIDRINVTDISIGEEFPIFSNCRVIAVEDPNSDGGRLQALMDVDLSDDNLSLAIETNLLLNYPKPASAVLPVALSVSVVRFSGTLCISFVPSPGTTESSPHLPHPENQNESKPSRQDPEIPTNKDGVRSGIPKTSLAFSFLPDYRLDISVRSLIGSRSRLQDVPKVAQLVEARVQSWFEDRVVEPRVQLVALPGIWPRMGRTGVRAQEDHDAVSIDSEDPATKATHSGFTPVNANRDGLQASRDLNMEGLRYRRGNAGDEATTDEYERLTRGDTQSVGEQLRIPGSLPGAPAVA